MWDAFLVFIAIVVWLPLFPESSWAKSSTVSLSSVSLCLCANKGSSWHLLLAFHGNCYVLVHSWTRPLTCFPETGWWGSAWTTHGSQGTPCHTVHPQTRPAPEIWLLSQGFFTICLALPFQLTHTYHPQAGNSSLSAKGCSYQNSRVCNMYGGAGNFLWPEFCLGQTVCGKTLKTSLWKHPLNLRGICSGLWINFVGNSVFKGPISVS